MDEHGLNQLVSEKRATQPPTPPHGNQGWQPARRYEPGTLAETAERILAKLPSPRVLSFEERERQQREEEAAERSARWRQFAEPLGPRYLACRFANFQIDDKGPHASAQHAVVEELQIYADNMLERVENGQGIVLFGPSGTGKDHLLTALAHRAIVQHGLCMCWVNGVELYRGMRDRLDTREAEQELIARYCWPTILYLSDPLPPYGDLTPFQAAGLFSIIDRRYRDRKPVWVTANVSNAEEAERRLGTAIVDRLRDNAISLRCAWPSYRKGAG